jgi:hypothetical protein
VSPQRAPDQEPEDCEAHHHRYDEECELPAGEPEEHPERRLREHLAGALGDRGHLDARAGDVGEHLVGRRLLAERPQLLQQ